MRIRPFTPDELQAIRRSGQILSEVLEHLVAECRAGRNALELDGIAEQMILEQGGQPAFKGYRGYPATLCVSRNDEVVHGIPKVSTVFQAGDLVSLDLGVVYHGMYTDMARTIGVGTIKPVYQKLLEATRMSLQAGLKVVKAGVMTGDIGAAIQTVGETAGFGIVRDLVGHGVGRSVHEEPSLPNFGRPHTGDTIPAGAALAIEPMLTIGRYEVMTNPDGWTVRTEDGSWAAHEERTVLVTERGFELLTPEHA